MTFNFVAISRKGRRTKRPEGETGRIQREESGTEWRTAAAKQMSGQLEVPGRERTEGSSHSRTTSFQPPQRSYLVLFA